MGKRIRYGDEHGLAGTGVCHDCGRQKGEFHVPGCDMEECSICHGQRIACDCRRKLRPAGPAKPRPRWRKSVAACIKATES